MSGIASIWRPQTYTSGTADALPPAILIWYTGTARGELTYASATFTFEEDDANDTSINNGSDAAGTLLTSTATTVGALVDDINDDTDGNWHARIVGAFRDTISADLLQITEIDVNQYGITGATGQRNGGVTFDLSDIGVAATDIVPLAVFGPEMDEDLGAGARLSENAYAKHRDVADSDLSDLKNSMNWVARCTYITGQIGNNAAGACVVKVISAKQSDDFVGAPVLWENVFANDTDETHAFVWPSYIQGRPGERLIVLADPAGGILDNIALTCHGGYGNLGLIPTP